MTKTLINHFSEEELFQYIKQAIDTGNVDIANAIFKKVMKYTILTSYSLSKIYPEDMIAFCEKLKAREKGLSQYNKITC